MNRRLTVSCLFLALLLSIIPVSGAHAQPPAAQPATAPSETELKLAGLRERVTVRRDERGIPHITATNEPDVYFAQGYVTASDRLWQMDLLRRTARGELSELFGRSTLDEDKRHRLFNFAGVTEAMVSRMPDALRAALESYVQGVNAFIASRDAASLPVEFRILRYQPRPWQVTDSLLVGKLFEETLTASWTQELSRAALVNLSDAQRADLFRDVSPLDVILVGSDRPKRKAAPARLKSSPPRPRAGMSFDMLRLLDRQDETMRRSLARVGIYAEDFAASNNWVVSGKHTATGKPLLANDPHLAPSAPSIWYMVHLESPKLQVAGVAALGAPGVAIGHNARIAWGMTSLEPDVADLYLEKFDEANPRRYMTPEGWREAEVRREEIKVRTNPADPATETETLEVTVTRHGPVVFENGGQRYALRWTALDPTLDFFGSISSFGTARNWNDFRTALSTYGGAPFNFVYADVDGHIGYYGAGPFPIRKTGDGSVPADGTTDDGEWTGTVPFKELPHLFDPPSGIIATANSRVVGTDYPHHLTNNWAPPYRARRIMDLLGARRRLTVEDFRQIQGDTYSYPDAIFTNEVVKAARLQVGKKAAQARTGDDAAWGAMLALFDGWNAVSNAESRVMPVAVEMRRAFRRQVISAALGEDRARQYGNTRNDNFIDWVITTRPPQWLPKEFKSYEDLLLASYQQAREALKKQLGEDETSWTWGRVRQVRFSHPFAGLPVVGAQFAIAPLPQNTGGSNNTINAGAFVSMRFIADLANWDNTLLGITLGVSGDPASPHWKDQLADWYAVQPRRLPFSSKAVAAATKQTMLLVPASR